MKRLRDVVAVLIPAFLALTLITGWSAPLRAQEDTAELRRELAAERARLEEQMKLLEQQRVASEEQLKRVDELERRLDSALAAPARAPEAPPVAPVPAPGDEAAPTEAQAPEIVPERLDIGKNETRDPHEVLSDAELVADDFRGSWPLFGTSYRAKLGGYFKMDALYDLDGAGDQTQFLIGQIPIEGTPEAGRSGYFNMFVRETRFNFDIRKSKSQGPAQQFFLEMDFFDERSFSPRLRHAYIVYGNLLAGQTWTTIADLASLAYVIDFGGGDALFGTRTPQLRWTQQVDENWSWALGLEALQSSGIFNPLGLEGRASPQLPVLAGRVSHRRSHGEHTLAALVQQLRWDGGGSGPNATAAGWAAIYGGRQNFARRDYFTWNLAYGDGTAETIMALTGSNANAVLTPEGRLITRKGYSAALGLGHKWSERLSSNLAYAWTDLEDLQRAPDAIRSGGVGHLNLIWAMAEKLSTGIEYIWGTRNNVNDASGDAGRFQMMLKYDF